MLIADVICIFVVIRLGVKKNGGGGNFHENYQPPVRLQNNWEQLGRHSKKLQF